MRNQIELTLVGAVVAAWMVVATLFVAQVMNAPPVYQEQVESVDPDSQDETDRPVSVLDPAEQRLSGKLSAG